ncbi:MAG: hypothetical protein ACRYFR_07260 [Janthinobacterium lividum]
MKTPLHKHWLVTASGEHPLREVEQHLTAAGFAVGQVLAEIGVITGAASDEVARRARALPGVADVSPDSPVDLDPPDAPVQ